VNSPLIRPDRRSRNTSAIHQNGDLRVRKNSDGLTADDDRRDPATPVRGHHDQITLSRLCGFDNRLINLFMLDVERVANNTGQFSSVRNDTKHFFGVSLGVSLVFDGRVFELARLDREQTEWFGDRTLATMAGAYYIRIAGYFDAQDTTRAMRCS